MEKITKINSSSKQGGFISRLKHFAKEYAAEERFKRLQRNNSKVILSMCDFEWHKGSIKYDFNFIPIIRNNKIGFVNANWETVITPIYEDYKKVYYFSNISCYCLKKNNKWGVIEWHSKEREVRHIIDFEYDDILPGYIPCKFNEIAKHLFTVNKNHKYGVVDEDNKIVVAFGEYDWIDGFTMGLARVMRKHKYGIIDYKGDIVLPIEYDSIGDFYWSDRVKTFIEKGKDNTEIDLLKLSGQEHIYDDSDCYNDSSAYDNQYYNDSLDFDQQSEGFWENF